VSLGALVNVLDVIYRRLAHGQYNSAVSRLTCCSLEVACGVVALRQEDVVVGAALEGLVKRDGLTHELFLNLAKTVKTGLKLKVVVGIGLGDG
jgi:hypothetical protein